MPTSQPNYDEIYNQIRAESKPLINKAKAIIGTVSTALSIWGTAVSAVTFLIDKLFGGPEPIGDMFMDICNRIDAIRIKLDGVHSIILDRLRKVFCRHGDCSKIPDEWLSLGCLKMGFLAHFFYP